MSKIGESLNDIFDGLEEMAHFKPKSNPCPKSPFFRRKAHLRAKPRQFNNEEEDTDDEQDEIEDEEAEIPPPIPFTSLYNSNNDDLFIDESSPNNPPSLLAALFLNPSTFDTFSLSGSEELLPTNSPNSASPFGKCLLLATSAS